MMSASMISVGLLTYAAHSVVACIAAFAAERVLARPRDRDVLWKSALLAPCVTAALALLLGDTTLTWPAVDLGGILREAWTQPLPDRNVTVLVHTLPSGLTSVQRTVIDPVDRALSIGTILIATICVGVALLRLIARYRTLSARVADRRTIVADAPIRITLSDNLPTPVALGRNEVCLPTFVERDFDRAKRAALIAHESEHLARRDPFWFAIIDLIGALSAFQPLCRKAIRAFRHNAELICDEAAVRATLDRGALIGALARLAAPYDDLAGAPAARSTRDARPLVARAERIASVEISPSDTATRRVVWLTALACCLALVALPTVRPAPRDPLPWRGVPLLTAGRRRPLPVGSLIVQRTVIRTSSHDRRLTRLQ